MRVFKVISGRKISLSSFLKKFGKCKLDLDRIESELVYYIGKSKRGRKIEINVNAYDIDEDFENLSASIDSDEDVETVISDRVDNHDVFSHDYGTLKVSDLVKHDSNIKITKYGKYSVTG